MSSCYFFFFSSHEPVLHDKVYEKERNILDFLQRAKTEDISTKTRAAQYMKYKIISIISQWNMTVLGSNIWKDVTFQVHPCSACQLDGLYLPLMQKLTECWGHHEDDYKRGQISKCESFYSLPLFNKLCHMISLLQQIHGQGSNDTVQRLLKHPSIHCL